MNRLPNRQPGTQIIRTQSIRGAHYAMQDGSDVRVLKARITLARPDGADNNAVAAKLWVTQQTVAKWRG